MFPEPTVLLWIGCLTGSIWTQKNQIRYIDSKHQLADILTKGNFTSDQWNNLLHLFNISHFSSLRCTKNFRLISCTTMAKRIQEQKKRRKGCIQVATCNEYVFSSYGVEDAGAKSRRKKCGKIEIYSEEPVFLMFRQVPHPRKV